MVEDEHLIQTKEVLSGVISNIFTWMLRRAFLPVALKRGVIVTLHKGNNKRKDNPDKYRTLTLS